ncbi:hypothetical protein P171DRAFT_267281 [Karstenula rhodostoma CBS 690.94]|uniref:Uncharacterized protein n=1 Tax=Karstenula rhodostoma CBS 690.94 TaxID=1392251 RepID=A0A9P4PK66_9PLEO|nr:hypothetical protein P171DRAFT_267281 [Karstenula rhodostoma CBS 690.94]
MADHTTIPTSRPCQNHDNPTPPPTRIPSLTHPPTIPSATHLLHLRITHLAASYASEIAASTHPHHILQLQHFFSDGMREYVSHLETLARGTVHEGLGMRMLRDAVARGWTPGVRWLDVSALVEGERRRAMVRGLEAWTRGLEESIWRMHWGARRRWAVEWVEMEAEGKRVREMGKWYHLAGLRGEELGWRMYCWEADLEVERSGVKSLEEEFREVGEWPEGCGPMDEDDVYDEDDGYVGDDEEMNKNEEQVEDGWVVVIPKHES